MNARIHIVMLGGFEVQVGSRKIIRFRTRKTASLLACLALDRTRSHAREVLIEQFWSDSDSKAARSNLSVALNALRHQLEPPDIPAGTVLISDHTYVRLNPLAFTTDVEQFETMWRTAEQETETEQRLVFRRKAIDLYHGDLMPGYYDDWVRSERDRLQDAYIGMLRQTIKDCAALRQSENAINYAHQLVQADPLREESYRILIRLFMAAGRPHDALHHYQELERILQTVLQTVPSSATADLAAQLSHLPPLACKPVGVPASDRSRTETQQGVLPVVREAASVPRKIPLQFTRFFGRAEEMERLAAWLMEDSHSLSAPTRLITLTGPGGTGKTRLSIEIAARVKAAFPGGVWFVPLVNLDDPLRIGETLRDTLELPHQPQPAPLEQVIAFLRGREQPILLILDNFEQIAAGGAPIVWTLLNRIPLLRCLVTSRHVLTLPGEQEVPLAPLPLPSKAPAKPKEAFAESDPNATPHHLLTYPSVALFVDRAQSARPEFQITPGNAQTIAALCQRVDGLPLAIELAAARVKALTPSQILERLSERFDLLTARRSGKADRHRSLWATMEWSFHLLTPYVQRFFARLSVFHGGWTLEAAEAVCREEATEQILSPLDILTQLRGHSLVHAEESSDNIRFRMLETLREYAAEQLLHEAQQEAERCHAAYFHRWVTGARLSREEKRVWFTRFEAEMDNLRAVFAWSLREGNAVEIGLEMASFPRNFWWVRGHLEEGRQWFARLLARADETPTLGRGRSLHVAGTLAYLQGDYREARELLEESREIAAFANDPTLAAYTQEALGSLAYRQGNYEQAHSHYENALEMGRSQKSELSLASILGNLANVAQSLGDFAASQALNGESLENWRAEGDRNGEARTLNNLGNLMLSQGKLTEARACYEQSTAIKRELGDAYSLSATLRGIAEVAVHQEDYDTAAVRLRESLLLAEETGARSVLLESLCTMAELLQCLGEGTEAAQGYGALEKAREEMNCPMPPVDKPAYERNLHALEEVLGTDVFQSAKQAGSKLSLEQALALAEETLTKHSL